MSLWRGEHIHHGYWPTKDSEATETKEVAQVNLIKLLLSTSQLPSKAEVLDVGCGLGGTSRYLASTQGCTVTGITISPKQVEIANRLTKAEAKRHHGAPGNSEQSGEPDADGYIHLDSGKVRFIELDAEKLADFFSGQEGTFDAVWISEALSHFSEKSLFFRNAHAVLRPGGKFVVADWFKAENLDQAVFTNDIKPIEGDYSLIYHLHRAQANARAEP